MRSDSHQLRFLSSQIKMNSNYKDNRQKSLFLFLIL